MSSSEKKENKIKVKKKITSPSKVEPRGLAWERNSQTTSPSYSKKIRIKTRVSLLKRPFKVCRLVSILH